MRGVLDGEKLRMPEPNSPASTGLKQGAATPLSSNRTQERAHHFVLQTA